MLTEKQLKGRSKLLSLILRHRPEFVGLILDSQGWTDVDTLLEKLQAKGKGLSREELDEVVEKNSKKRFAFNADKTKIRASQGHSVKLDLGYEAVQPPEFLYHGTATRFVNSIRGQGLKKKSRHHLHLSLDIDTAKNVGSRHGVPVILTIKAQEMHEAGFEFFVSANDVWLTDNVPTEYLVFP